jgi:hypothetical protein
MKRTFVRYLILVVALSASCSKLPTNNNEVWVRFEDATQQLYGFKDLNGKVKVSARYWDCPTDTFRTIAFVGIEKEGWVCIDKDLNKLFHPYIWDNSVDRYQSGLIRVQEKGKIGFADTSGQIIIPPIYDAATPFDNNFAGFYSGGKYVCLENGTSDAQCEHKGWVGGLWGFINKTNDTLVPPTLTHEELQDINIASLTAKNPNSDSYIEVAGKQKTYYLENVRKAFKTFFSDFLRCVETKDYSYLKSVCYQNIKCTYCLLNTKKEYDSLVKAKLYTPGYYYTNMRDKEIFSIQKFIDEDYGFVFSQQAIRNLRDTSMTDYFIDYTFPFFLSERYDQFLTGLEKQRKYFKITAVVNCCRDNPRAFQEHYEFIKTDKGIKFIGYARTIEGYRDNN